MKKILILIDYRGTFYSSVSNNKTLCSYDIVKVKKYLEDYGYVVEISSFSSIDYFIDFSNYYVLYQSSEDYNLEYKSYIEDIITYIYIKGGTLIPKFEYMKSHHNKNMMELIRKNIFENEQNQIKTYHFGTYEELEQKIEFLNNFPYILKLSNGSGSKEVFKVENKCDLKKRAKKISKSLDSLLYTTKELLKRLLRKNYIKYSLHRRKFIVQEFIKGLDGDFKILHFGGKYFVLSRANRENDFRASGSGKFSYIIPSNVNIQDLLNYAQSIVDKINTPIHSLDIGFDGDRFHLIEFQTIMFGTYTIEKSEMYYVKIDGNWRTIYSKVILEKEFIRSLLKYIQEHDMGEI